MAGSNRAVGEQLVRSEETPVPIDDGGENPRARQPFSGSARNALYCQRQWIDDRR